MIGYLHTLLLRDLGAFTKEIEAFPDDAGLWATAPGVTNAAGNLALHVAGNLQHFVGALLGGTGYVRDREREFSRRSGSRAEVVQELRRALQTVETVLPGLTAADLERDFPLALDGQHLPVNVFLLRLGFHLAYHLGQANYLRRMLVPGQAPE